MNGMWEPSQADKDSIALMHFFRRFTSWFFVAAIGLYGGYYILRRCW